MDLAECSYVVARMRTRKQSVLRKKEDSSRYSLADLDGSNNDPEDGRAQKLDGAFFEGFVEIKLKQKEHEEEAAKGSLWRESQSSQVVTPGQIVRPIEKNKALELYKELVYTTMYQLGKKSREWTDGEIYEYGRQVFDISDAEHKAVYNDVKSLKAPECYLNLRVLSGEDLDAKDANGFSDPYCMMCVINEGDGERINDNGNKRKRKVLREFVKDTDVKLTKIKMKTLNPEWNQQFKFLVTDLTNQKLRLDMWDKDDNSVVLDADNTITAIKGFKGAGRFLKEIYQSAKYGKENLDDFMGLVEVPLKNIPEHGLDTWFAMEGRSTNKSEKGRIHLKLSLSTRAHSTGISIAHNIKQHAEKPCANISDCSVSEIYRDFYNHFARYDYQCAINDQPNESWDGQLCDHAQSILLQYSMQHEIRPIEDAAIKCHVFCSLSREVCPPLDVLNEMLEIYRNLAQGDSLDTENETEDFVQSLHTFVTYGLGLLAKYRYVFSMGDPKKCVELGKLLLCLLIIYRLPVYIKKFSNHLFIKDIESTLEKSTTEWFTIEEAFHQTMQKDTYDVIQYLVNLTNSINADMKRGVEKYAPVFKVINVNYMTVVFNKIEVLLSGILQQETKEVENKFPKSCQSYNNEVAGLWFELYLSVRNLYEMKKNLPEEDRNEGGFNNWSGWFKKGVVRWLSIASDKAESRIVKALEMDEVRVIDSMVKHSTSAVDVTCCLGQICIFWNDLDWPDPLGAFTFLAQIIGIIGKCAMDYGRMVLDQLKHKGFYDDIGQFDVTDELCIMMNNMEHVLQFLEHVPKVCNFEKVFLEMREESDEQDIAKSSYTLHEILLCAKDDMTNKLEQIILHVGERMKESLNNFTIKIITNNNKEVENSCEPLLKYFDSNLLTLNTSLLTPVFDKVLEHMWKTFLQCLQEIIQKKKLLQIHFKKLIDLLEIVRHVFYGDGNGLSQDVLDSDLCKDVRLSLDLNKATTYELIEEFFADRCTQQKNAQSSIGVITFKVFFCNLTKKLNVNVLNCFDLIPMDSSGTSDPYVTLEIKPQHLFPTQKMQRTKVEKETLFPLFDATFQFDIPPPDCLKQGATLVFTLFDHDLMIGDDIAGQIYYNLQFVPGITYETVQGGFATTPQVQMPFIVPALEGKAVTVLKSRRPDDQLATNFLSTQKKTRKKMVANIEKGRQYNSK